MLGSLWQHTDKSKARESTRRRTPALKAELAVLIVGKAQPMSCHGSRRPQSVRERRAPAR